MAKVTFTAAVAGMSGKLAGSVFSFNRAGAYVRSKGTTTNRRSMSQQLVRGRFGGLASTWPTLSEQDKASWNQLASNYPVIQRDGTTKLLSGSQLFSSLNNNMLKIGSGPGFNTAAPPLGGAVINYLYAPVFAADQSASTMTLDLTNAIAANTATQVVVYATSQLSSGITNPSPSAFRQIIVLPNNAIGSGAPINIMPEYAAVFGGNVYAGKQIFLELEAVNSNSGEASARLRVSTIVTV